MKHQNNCVPDTSEKRMHTIGWIDSVVIVVLDILAVVVVFVERFTMTLA